jgi:hypothetical protein
MADCSDDAADPALPEQALPARILDDPRWLCIGFERASARLHFMFADEDALERSVFLDPRVLDSTRHVAVPLRSVIDTVSGWPAPAAPHGGLILHPAFACSTLLARCIEAAPRRRVLRELPVLSGLAQAREELDPSTWRGLLQVLARLTARPFAPSGHTCNKPSNAFLAVAQDWLLELPGTRAVVIDIPLDAYLLSAAKKLRAGTAPWRAMHAGLDPAGHWLRANRLDPEQLDPLRWAATLWHLQMTLLDELARSPAGARVRRVGVDPFMAAPEATVRAAMAWLAPGTDPSTDPQRIAAELGRHAKQPGLAYGPAQRREEARWLQTNLGQPLHATMAWSRARFGDESRAAGYPIASLPA